MTISGYSNAIVDTMLGWLKGLANWVLRLFNLAGSAGGSPLMWLSQNWLRLLVLLMIIGVSADILVWLVRWRPHWVWFRRQRVIVDDESFFDESDIQSQLHPDDDDEYLEKNWEERDYVVASTVVSRRQSPARGSRSTTPGRRRPVRTPQRRAGEAASVKRGEKRRRPPMERNDRDAGRRSHERRAEREADLFGMDGSRPGVTDFYEDEVFNVNNLPEAEERH